MGVAVAPKSEVGEPADHSVLAGDRFERLSPGPGLAASQVAADQRRRLRAAMVELVDARGHEGVTLRALAATAKVSTRDFYEHFRGKEDCFLQAHELVVRHTARRVVAAQSSGGDWRERLRLSLLAFLQEVDREPVGARVALIDIHSAGPTARARARRAECSFEAILADTFRRCPDGNVAPPLAIEGIVAGVEEVARRMLLSNNPWGAGDVADELAAWAIECRDRAVTWEASGRLVSAVPLTVEAQARTGSDTTDRDIILTSVAKLLSSTSPDTLTVSRIRAAAGVSRRRFDAHFKDVQSCVVALAERSEERAFELAVSARESGPARSAAIRDAVAALCWQVAVDPTLARLCFTRDVRAGTGDRRGSADAVDAIAGLLYASAPLGEIPPPVTVTAIAGMIWGVMSHRVLAGRASSLPCLSAELSALASVPAGDLYDSAPASAAAYA